MSPTPRHRVVVGLSGGVDSAVTAHLLKQQGHEVIGIFMKNWEDDDDSEFCSSRQDFLDAASVADVLGIDMEHVNFAADYKDRVFAEFLREYQAGRTPNPDVLCNAEIKFKAFLDHALRLGAEKIATGHYARVRSVADSSFAGGERFELLKGLDPLKDQSYFLHRLSQAQLSKTMFPVGELPKTEVGEHVGLSFYTLGQRKGIGIGGVKEKGAQRGGSEHNPWFVARKDMAKNTLYVVQGHDHPWLQQHTLVADDLSWVDGRGPLAGSEGLGAKSRYRQADAPCEVNSASPEQISLHFPQAQWAVTPGQSAVLYQGDVCLGGGVISASN
jgi:tRNA-specific 2-thiouridylase